MSCPKCEGRKKRRWPWVIGLLIVASVLLALVTFSA
jgi:hypothetical protein